MAFVARRGVRCNRGVVATYRLSPRLAARFLGGLFVGLGALVVAFSLFALLLGVPDLVLGVSVALALVVLVVAGALLVRGTVIVRLDEVGYRVRLLRGAGVPRARWVDVEDAVAMTVAGERCVVLRLRDGGTTTIPVRVLEGSVDSFLEDLQTHLNAGHGYRRLG